MDDQERLQNAKRHVARLRGFYIHSTVFVLVLLGLFGLNLWLGPPYWVLFVFIGWGIGILGHAAGTFGRGIGFGAEWEARKVKEIMDKSRQS